MNNRISSVLYIIILLFFFSCNQINNESTKLIDQEKNPLTNYYDNYIIDDIDRVFLFHIIIRDCYCVEENIDFLIENISHFNNKNTFLVVKNDTDKFKSQLNNLSINLLNNENDDFGNFGNVFATDKLFIFEKGLPISKIELKKENYHEIIKIIKLNNNFEN